MALVPELTINHLVVNGRIDQITSISVSLNDTKTKLQAEARKTPLVVLSTPFPITALPNSVRSSRRQGRIIAITSV